MIRPLHPFLAGLLLATFSTAAAPVRVSFLNTDETREDTLRILAEAGCEPANLDALRKAMQHYYRAPLALDTSAFPHARAGFHEFASVADFVSALGTNQLSFLDHGFELNCYLGALMLAETHMDIAANLQTRDAPWLGIQVAHNFNEWLAPFASLGDVYAGAVFPELETALEGVCGIEFSDKLKALMAALYQYQTLPLGTSADTIAAETQAALRRHWQRCGIQFPANLSLVMLHRARTDYHLAVTDHMGVLLRQKDGWLYLEKTGGKGPFLRIDVKDPAEIAAYFSTGTWPDYPFNFMSVNDGLFLDVPLKPRATSPPPATADRAKQAIRRRYNEISAEKLDNRGYAATVELNLLPGVRLEDVQADFAQGSGNELDGKFRAAHSSAALAVNAFGPWRNHPHGLSLLGKSGFTRLQFEQKCPTGLGGIPPNLDVLVEGPGVVIGIESKFLEILAPKQPEFADSYARENLPQMEAAWWSLLCKLKAGPAQHLDAAQLVRHYLGLRNQPEFRDRKIVLLYLFWEPANWQDFPEYRRHREEIAAFQDQVKDSAVTFTWMTYPELWRHWDALGLFSGHVLEIRKRYSLAI